MAENVASLRLRLERAFEPEYLEVEDESELHRGHAGWRDGGGTHFRIRVVSTRFLGVTRLERHRLVHAVLADCLDGSVHALAIEARAPGEDGPRLGTEG